MVGHGRERTDVDSRPGVSTVVAERDPGQTAIPCWQVDAAFTVGRELASKAAADAALGARIAAQKSRSSGLDERRAPVRAARAGRVADLVKAVVHHPRIAACRLRQSLSRRGRNQALMVVDRNRTNLAALPAHTFVIGKNFLAAAHQVEVEGEHPAGDRINMEIRVEGEVRIGCIDNPEIQRGRDRLPAFAFVAGPHHHRAGESRDAGNAMTESNAPAVIKPLLFLSTPVLGSAACRPTGLKLTLRFGTSGGDLAGVALGTPVKLDVNTTPL